MWEETICKDCGRKENYLKVEKKDNLIFTFKGCKYMHNPIKTETIDTSNFNKEYMGNFSENNT